MGKVQTARFGEIEVKEEDRVELSQGLLGFPHRKSFVLLEHEADSPFTWLQSLEDEHLAFILVDPARFYPGYQVTFGASEIKDLDLYGEEGALIYALATVSGEPEEMTANLKAPLVVNRQNRKGKQVVLSDPQYGLRHCIFREPAAQFS